MSITVKLQENSSFNDEEHFLNCLKDLVIEWEDTLGAKEMDTEDVGFNCERLREFKSMLEEIKK